MRTSPSCGCKISPSNKRGNRTATEDKRLNAHLRPHLKRGSFAEDEDELIIKLHALLGDKWALIAGRLPGRTENEIKNYWNVHLKRKLLSRGVDPHTRRPIRQPQSHFSPMVVNLTSVQSQSEHEVSDAASGSSDERPMLNLELCIATLPSSRAAASATCAAHGDVNEEVSGHGTKSVEEELRGLIKPVCHRVGQPMPRTLVLLR